MTTAIWPRVLRACYVSRLQDYHAFVTKTILLAACRSICALNFPASCVIVGKQGPGLAATLANACYQVVLLRMHTVKPGCSQP